MINPIKTIEQITFHENLINLLDKFVDESNIIDTTESLNNTLFNGFNGIAITTKNNMRFEIIMRRTI
jgi:hypothetical protein